MLLFTWAQLRTFLLIVIRSTRNRSTATKMCWMKKTTNAISGIASKESVRVALLQTLGEDGAIRSTLRWSQNDLSSVQFFQFFWERSTNSFCIESTHLPSFDRWDLSARPCPSGCRLLQFDQCWFEIHEIRDLLGSYRESLQILSWCISCLDCGRCSVLLFFSLPITMTMRSPFLSDIVRDWEKIQCPSENTSAGLILSQEMPASAVDDALIPVKKALFALHFRNCVA